MEKRLRFYTLQIKIAPKNKAGTMELSKSYSQC